MFIRKRMATDSEKNNITVIIGLGNPGKRYEYTRHNIGFLILDFLADACGAVWEKKELLESAHIKINGKIIELIKPQTSMNVSGKIFPYLSKRGVKAENILAVQDELDMPFGKTRIKVGGSARGHNGIKSLIQACGPHFKRLCFGVDRPKNQNDVIHYVLEPFSQTESAALEEKIKTAVELIEKTVIA